MTLRLYGTTDATGQATVTEFRYGPRMLSTLSYKTIGYTSGGVDEWGNDNIVVDEILRYFTRPNAVYDSNVTHTVTNGGLSARPRMSSGETVFWYPDETCYWTRPVVDYIPATENMRDYSAQGNSTKSVGLKFRLYKERQYAAEVMPRAYLDNALFNVSGIMWEFSPDGGNKWYQLYDLPNKPYMRVSLPGLTGQLRVRASSCSPDDWISGYSIEPRSDYHALPAVPTTLTIPYSDAFGYVRWKLEKVPDGNIIYRVISDSGMYFTRNTQLHVPSGWSFFDITAYTQSGEIIGSASLTGAGQYTPSSAKIDVYLLDDDTEYATVTYPPVTIPSGVTGITCELVGVHAGTAVPAVIGSTVSFDNSGTLAVGSVSSPVSWVYDKDDEYRLRILYSGKYADTECSVIYHNYTSERYSGDFKSNQTRYGWLQEGQD